MTKNNILFFYSTSYITFLSLQSFQNKRELCLVCIDESCALKWLVNSVEIDLHVSLKMVEILNILRS